MIQKKYFLHWLLLCLFFTSSVKSQTVPKSNEPFNIRGFHLDLRIQVMTMAALRNFALQLSKNGINTLVMEWEASYPYKDQPLIPNRYAYSREEVRSFTSYCKSLGIEVIPLQQSFGHVEYILRNYKYAALREDTKDFSQVCPLETEGNRELFYNLFSDLTSTHSSRFIHIGGDETRLLGHCEKCRKRALEAGNSRLYIDHIKMLCDLVIKLGKRPVLWADIAIKYPDAIHLLPKETVFVDWNYGWDLDRFGNHQKLLESGYEIWGAPSIRSHPDNYFLAQWKKHFDNIHDFIPVARKLGYKGIIMTSWSTSGEYSPVFDTPTDIIDLYAIRHVYPVTGFNMLISAFCESLASSAPLPVEAFIFKYAQDKYGFSKEQSQQFWKALSAAPYEVNQGVVSKPGVSIRQVLDSAVQAATVLHSLKPLRNKEEFSHYQLMADIRKLYLSYMDIEARVNSASFTTAQVPAVLKSLESLPVGAINQRFIELNRNSFHLAELEQENELRNAKIKILYNRLSRDRN